MASVRKRDPSDPKSPWVVEYTDAAGKRRRKTPKSGLRKDADRIRRQVEAEIEAGVHTPARESITFAEAALEFERDCDRRQKIGDRMTKTTLRAYRISIAKRINPRIGSISLADLTSIQIQDLINGMLPTYSVGTVKHTYVALNQVLAYAAKRKWTKRNVLRDDPVRLPPSTGERVRIPTKADIRSLLQAAGERRFREREVSFVNRQLVVALGLFGGMRKGEMLGLQWSNCDFDRGVIMVRHSLSDLDGLKGPKTRAGVRDFPMSSPVRDALMAVRVYWSGQPGGLPEYVLRSGTGERPSHDTMWRAYWMRTLGDAGLIGEDGKSRFTMHALRHAAVSLLIEAGLPPMHIKAFIGHTSVRTTFDVYGHLFPDDGLVRSVTDTIAAQFNAPEKRLQTIGH